MPVLNYSAIFTDELAIMKAAKNVTERNTVETRTRCPTDRKSPDGKSRTLHLALRKALEAVS
jgi:hypothetical protein